MQDPTPDRPGRDHWSSSLGFVLAAAGSAVGLGNLWKFPYITYDNHGGAFVLVYLACILAVGLPIMMAEILLGRMTQQSPVGAMKAAVGRHWALVGGLGVLAGFVILGYYNVVAGWSLRSFVQCAQWSASGFPAGAAIGDDFGAFIGSAGLQVGLAALFMGVTVFVVSRGISHGIERVARILLPTLFGILLLLLVSALRMEGAGEALGFIFRPDFSQLDRHGLLEALGHAFFTLSLGMGAMITYGSYLSRRDSVVKSAGVIVALDTFIALLATVIMFSVIFSVPAVRDGIGRSTVGMLFVTLPELFYTSVPGGRLLGPLFYLLVAFAALTSTISLLEVVSSYFIDEKGWTRTKASVVCGAIIYGVSVLCALSLGANDFLSSVTLGEFFNNKHGVFELLDHLASNWLLPVGGLLITLAAGWVLDPARARAELADDPPAPGFSFGLWRFFIRFVAPVAVGAIVFAVIRGSDFS